MAVVAIIQARLGSQRFPNKVLADLCGRPVLQHVVERAQQIKGVDQVIVAAPHEDVPTLSAVVSVRVKGYPQLQPNDVLGRFAIVANAEPSCHTVMRITSDCPLLDPGVCSRVLALYESSACDYAWTDTHSGKWPDGLDCEVFPRWLLKLADREATDPADREHVTSWMRRQPDMTIESLAANKRYARWPKLSVDTPEDLDRVRQWMRRAAA